MALLTMIFNRHSIQISEKKTIGPTTCLEYLDIILDTESMEARLPEDKVSRIIDFIESFLRKPSVRKITSSFQLCCKSGAIGPFLWYLSY